MCLCQLQMPMMYITWYKAGRCRRWRSILGGMARCCTPLDSGIWARELEGHPDQVLVREILRGINEGFKVGYDHTRAPLRTQGTNMPSATEHSSVMEEYLAGEVEAGRVALAGTTPAGKGVGHSLQPIWCHPQEQQAGQFQTDPELVGTGRSRRERRHKQGASLSVLRHARRGGRFSGKVGAWGTAGEDAHKASLLPGVRTPSRHAPLGYAMEGQGVRQYDAPIRPEVGPIAVHCTSRCGPVGDEEAWYITHLPLCG